MKIIILFFIVALFPANAQAECTSEDIMCRSNETPTEITDINGKPIWRCECAKGFTGVNCQGMNIILFFAISKLFETP